MSREQATGAEQANGKPATFEEWYVPSSYQMFVGREGVPLYQGSALESLLTLPLGEWERRGGKAAYTRLGDQEVYGLQVVEIPPAGQLQPEHHIYDAVMYVLRGQGATTFWQEGEAKQTVEWHEGSLLAIPLNAWHQEFNNSGTEPCRMVFGTNLPQMINHFHNLDFVFGCPFAFTDRYTAMMPNYYADRGTHWNLRLYETNFIPDIRYFALDDWEEKGHRTAIMRISMASTSLGIHILDVSEGTYVMAHRHGAGAHVMVISGDGYELLYFEGEEEHPREIALRPSAVVAPKPNEFHQHFNSGKGPLRQLAFRSGPARYGTGYGYNPVGAAQDTDPNANGYKIAYERENPTIREEYYRRLQRSGVESRLPPLAQRPG